MKEQKFSICRSKSTTKPRVMCPQVIFYYCNTCNNLLFTISSNTNNIYCCNDNMQVLEAKTINEIDDAIVLDYKIVGGYNSNAVEVFWKYELNTYIPKWLYLKTFTGGQLKYIVDSKKNSLLFALAEEDAYVYCDEDPCLECTFRCKRGFEIYAYYDLMGLVKVPLNKMHASW